MISVIWWPDKIYHKGNLSPNGSSIRKIFMWVIVCRGKYFPKITGLTHTWPIFPSYKNHLIDLYWKVIDWFLYDDIMLCSAFVFVPKGFQVNVSRITLTHFIPLVSFYTPWKHRKAFGFVVFSGGIERDQLHEMGWYYTENVSENVSHETPWYVLNIFMTEFPII